MTLRPPARAVRAALIACLAWHPSASPAEDRWTRVAPPVRLLERRVVLGDGAGTDLLATVVDLCDPSVTLRATAPGEGGRTVADWAGGLGLTVAVNGDYFDRGHGYVPSGPARGNGRWWPGRPQRHHDALLLLGGVPPVGFLTAAPHAHPALWADATTLVDERHGEVVAAREQVLAAGRLRESPSVVHDGQRHPRTALGLSRDGRTLVLLVADGRTPRSAGLRTDELGAALRDLGATEGFKLDGGGSSTMWVAGRGVVNHPSDGSARRVANHVGLRLRTDGLAPVARSWCATVPSGVTGRGPFAVLGALTLAGVLPTFRGRARRRPPSDT